MHTYKHVKFEFTYITLTFYFVFFLFLQVSGVQIIVSLAVMQVYHGPRMYVNVNGRFIRECAHIDMV